MYLVTLRYSPVLCIKVESCVFDFFFRISLYSNSEVFQNLIVYPYTEKNIALSLFLSLGPKLSLSGLFIFILEFSGLTD